MANKSRGGKSDKAQYAAYKAGNKWQKNKIRKLEKRILANENDSGAESALKIAHTKLYGRAKPRNKGWFPPQEHKLELLLKNVDTYREAKEKLIKLKDVFMNERPSPLHRSTPIVNEYTSIPDQLFTIGFISDQKRKFVNTRLERVRSR